MPIYFVGLYTHTILYIHHIFIHTHTPEPICGGRGARGRAGTWGVGGADVCELRAGATGLPWPLPDAAVVCTSNTGEEEREGILCLCLSF